MTPDPVSLQCWIRERMAIILNEGMKDGGPMKCIRCDRQAEAICRFCGRAVCKDHMQTLNYIVTAYPGMAKKVTKALVVADAVFCGICKPQPEPLETPYLD